MTPGSPIVPILIATDSFDKETQMTTQEQPKEEAWEKEFDEKFGTDWYGNAYRLPDLHQPQNIKSNDVKSFIRQLISTERQRHEEEIGKALKRSWDKSINEGTDWDLGDALKALSNPSAK